MVEVKTLPGHVQPKAVALAAHALLALARRGTVGGRAGNQRRQLQVVASVERQLDDAAILDDGANRCVRRLDHRRVRHDTDDIGQLADREGERESVRASDLHLDVRLLGRRESFQLDLE